MTIRTTRLEAGPFTDARGTISPGRLTIRPVTTNGLPWYAPSRIATDNNIFTSDLITLQPNAEGIFSVNIAPSDDIGSNYLVNFGGDTQEINVPVVAGDTKVLLRTLIQQRPLPRPGDTYLDAAGARRACKISLLEENDSLPPPTAAIDGYMALDETGTLQAVRDIQISEAGSPTWTWTNMSSTYLPGHTYSWLGVYNSLYSAEVQGAAEYNDVIYLTRFDRQQYRPAGFYIYNNSPQWNPLILTDFWGAHTEASAEEEGITSIGSIIYDSASGFGTVKVLTGYTAGSTAQTQRVWTPVLAYNATELLADAVTFNSQLPNVWPNVSGSGGGTDLKVELARALTVQDDHRQLEITLEAATLQSAFFATGTINVGVFRDLPIKDSPLSGIDNAVCIATMADYTASNPITADPIKVMITPTGATIGGASTFAIGAFGATSGTTRASFKTTVRIV